MRSGAQQAGISRAESNVEGGAETIVFLYSHKKHSWARMHNAKRKKSVERRGKELKRVVVRTDGLYWVGGMTVGASRSCIPRVKEGGRSRRGRAEELLVNIVGQIACRI